MRPGNVSMPKKLRRFYLTEIADLDHPTFKKFISRTTPEGRVLSRRNTDEYAERWAEVHAVNMAEAKKKFKAGKVTWYG